VVAVVATLVLKSTLTLRTYLSLIMAFLSRMFKDRPGGVSSSHSAMPSFKYMPLQDNSIRVVSLQPRRSTGSADIKCTLSHVAFGDMPQYDALSYTWGDGIVKRTIFLNEISVEVGENLAAALVNIRGLESAGEKPRTLWIDAICINQSDLAERSRQVRFMPLIYERAQMVLVWLGLNGTFKAHCREEVNQTIITPKHRWTNGLAHGPVPPLVVVDLCGREYWKRLWIIQEIGKARILRIHYNSKTIQWKRFIENVKSDPKLAGSIPLRLEAQVRGPYDSGLNLCSLLRTYQGALCKDPRDKIYGFLGLAIDIHDGFPIDYSKSLFEVFTDTIFHQNRSETRSQHDILEVSRLVARMLGGRTRLEPDGPARSFYAGDISIESTDAQVRRLHVPGRLAGRINHIGPLRCDVMASADKLNEWTSLIWSNISDALLRATVLEQSILFRESIERLDEVSQRTVFAFDRDISWKDLQQSSLETLKRNYGSAFGIGPSQSTDSSCNGCRLFLLQPPALEHTASWMGLAPRGTQVGDFVCQFAGIECAVIIRQLPTVNPTSAINQSHYTYKIIGCAGLARDSDTARPLRGTPLLQSKPFDAGKSSPPVDWEKFNLYMDIHTAHEISC
jgi:hypothetical protein